MYEVRRYTADRADEWNRFVAASKQGTFLFDRRFMDYHADRFRDHSLLVYRDQQLYALLPANEREATLVSHGGLTYGGLLTTSRCSATGVIEVFKAINDYLHSAGICRVIYKAIPHIYHQQPAEEDLYALTVVCQARLTIRDISSAIVAPHRQRFSESRRSGLRKAVKAGLHLCESADVDAFWHILNDNLTQKYAVRPVHTADELRLLRSRFPDNIKLWLVFDGDTPIGGTLLFLTPRVLHTQYISATARGKQLGAIDLLFDHLINHIYCDYPVIDFGKSTVSDSADLNSQLIFQKEGFGASAVCYDTYEWEIEH
ncbi:MAG: GNAT family N-acetyltransferase [Prevotella sp.]|nr:GNAT family N-acetyltransferase [Prevotella sp.]